MIFNKKLFPSPYVLANIHIFANQLHEVPPFYQSVLRSELAKYNLTHL